MHTHILSVALGRHLRSRAAHKLGVGGWLLGIWGFGCWKLKFIREGVWALVVRNLRFRTEGSTCLQRARDRLWRVAAAFGFHGGHVLLHRSKAVEKS